MEKSRLLSLIKEVFRTIFKEAKDSDHSITRFEKRIRETKIGNDKEMEIIYKNLNIIKGVAFLDNYSYLVKIINLKIDKNSPYYFYDKGDYYRVEDDIKPGEYSIGNEIWALIRKNETKTIMLRRKSQNVDIKNSRDKLSVDYALNIPFGMDAGDFQIYVNNLKPPKK